MAYSGSEFILGFWIELDWIRLDWIELVDYVFLFSMKNKLR